VAFKLVHQGSNWTVSPLYEFGEGSDGAGPFGGLVIGPNGALYGTTYFGGAQNYGTVFELRPPLTACKEVLCYWSERQLYTFTEIPDGQYPEFVNLVFDHAGNIYGTTVLGGTNNQGTAFELTPSGGGYTESIPHSFGGSSDGAYPYAAGNVYGNTYSGGTGTECRGGCGTVYQLMPAGDWLENIVVDFDVTNGFTPLGGLIIDASGNLYGTTTGGGEHEFGEVFKLAPSGGGFTYTSLYAFDQDCDSQSGVTLDAAGNFFGTCYDGGAYSDGWIFELTNCSETCTVVDLHDFSGSDGWYPYDAPVLDANGNLYGTTYAGGTGKCGQNGCGVVWEITP
jgi:uncharacterized repeat protein (TIGR03803 family)